MKGSIVLYAIPFFFLLIGIELMYFYFKKESKYRLNDSLNNLSLGVGNQVAGALTKTFVFGIVIYAAEHWALFKLPSNWFTFLICFVFYDFLYYWSHRWGHTVSFFWGAHIVHHQSEEYNLSVALRQSWFHSVIAFFMFLPLPILGFEPLIIGLSGGINLLYQFWIHTEAIGKMPRWFEAVFNTPSHHRVHHAINPEYIDRNHAGVFMIWDQLFGTFQEEKEGRPIRYGITTQLKSWDPVWANFHFYVELWDKMKLANGFSNKVKLVFQKPGFNPVTQSEDIVPEPDFKKEKFDADANSRNKWYALFQFVIVIAGSVIYLINFKDLSLGYKLVFAAMIFFSIEIIGGIFEQKKWAVIGEYLRVLFVVIGINYYYYFNYPLWMSQMLIASTAIAIISFISYTFLVKNDLIASKNSIA